MVTPPGREYQASGGQTVVVSTQTWTTGPAPPSSSAPEWRGVHPLAMVTPDMDTTVRFYVGVLGMPLVAL